MTFHFLRPWWLVIIPVAIGLVWLWHRRVDPHRKWEGIIAPHLLDALLTGDHGVLRIMPVHLIAAAMILGAIATAGPTWRKEPPPFSDDKAPMVVAIDLSGSMDATDIAPTRLERTKQKVRDLMHLRAGSRTGLVVYGGSAHMVLPPADDAALMQLFLDALETSLMPRSGRDAAGALSIADSLLDKEPVAGTTLFLTDGFDAGQIAAFRAHADQSRHQLLVLSVGTEEGGPLRRAGGRIATDASGRTLHAQLDKAVFERLSSEADIPVASVTLDDSDLRWVQRRAQRHMQAVQQADAQLRWKEYGYWLVFPIAVLAALWFRKGTVVRWAAVALLAVALGAPDTGHAASFRFADLFLTADQQGRWHFERHDFAEAAQRFKNPLWKGLSFYRSGDYSAALEQFARLDTPDAYFLIGNCQAHLHDFPRAVAAYDYALKVRPDFPQAAANRKLVADLIPKKKKDEQGEDAPALPPDDFKFDEKGKHGKTKQMSSEVLRKQTAAMWMRNLKISPTDFLRQKFEIEAATSDTGKRP